VIRLTLVLLFGIWDVFVTEMLKKYCQSLQRYRKATQRYATANLKSFGASEHQRLSKVPLTLAMRRHFIPPAP